MGGIAVLVERHSGNSPAYLRAPLLSHSCITPSLTRSHVGGLSTHRGVTCIISLPVVPYQPISVVTVTVR